MSSPFPCSPLIREWSWEKTQIERKQFSFFLSYFIKLRFLSDCVLIYFAFDFWFLFVKVIRAKNLLPISKDWFSIFNWTPFKNLKIILRADLRKKRITLRCSFLYGKVTSDFPFDGCWPVDSPAWASWIRS